MLKSLRLFILQIDYTEFKVTINNLQYIIIQEPGSKYESLAPIQNFIILIKPSKNSCSIKWSLFASFHLQTTELVLTGMSDQVSSKWRRTALCSGFNSNKASTHGWQMKVKTNRYCVIWCFDDSPKPKVFSRVGYGDCEGKYVQSIVSGLTGSGFSLSWSPICIWTPQQQLLWKQTVAMVVLVGCTYTVYSNFLILRVCHGCCLLHLFLTFTGYTYRNRIF